MTDAATDDAVEKNRTFHDDVMWLARLMVPSINYTAVRVMWDMPTSTANNKLCAFLLHYYRGNSVTTRGSSALLPHGALKNISLVQKLQSF